MLTRTSKPGGSAWARRAVFLAILGALAAMLIATVVDTDTDGSTQPLGSDTQGICGLEGIECATVRDDTGREVEYAVKRLYPEGDRGVVLLEAGGPGSDVFMRSSDEFLELPAPLDRFDVLIIREPWTAQGKSEACSEGAAEVASYLSEAGQPVEALLDCDMQTWDEEGYRSAVLAVGAAIEGEIVGIVGQSFGTLPALSAAKAMDDAWLVVNAPMAPPSGDPLDLVDQQTAQLERVLNDDFDRWCHEQQCETSLDQVWSRVADAGPTAGVSSDEFVLAALAAAYNLESNGDWLWDTMYRHPSLDTATVDQVERMASQLLRRYGDAQIDPSMAAYALGLCRTYTGWDEHSLAPGSGPAGSLTRMSSLCGQLTPSKAPTWQLDELSELGASCIILNDLDPVVAPAWGEDIAQSIGHAEISRIERAGHVSVSTVLSTEPDATACVNAAIEGATR